MSWRFYDKLVYSIVWLLLLLWALSWVIKQKGLFWDITFGFMLVAIGVQLGLVIYNASDAYSRHKLRQVLQGKKLKVTSGTGEEGEI